MPDGFVLLRFARHPFSRFRNTRTPSHTTMKLTLTITLLAVCAAAVRGSTTRSSSTVFLGQQVDKKRLLKRIAGVQGDDVCVGMKSANSGYRFKTATEGVLFEKCADGRDCHRLVDCKTSKNKLCLEAFECEDLRGAKRCLKFEPCQCLAGEFALKKVEFGFLIEDETASGLSYKDRKHGKTGLYGVFKQQQCFNAGFNLNSCSPSDDDCQAMVPCVSAENQTECYALIAADAGGTTTTTTSTV